MAPFDIQSDIINYLIFFSIGIGFGSILEMSGFGDSRKLAAQFYLKDVTVLKVMFTAIIVGATLIFLSSALGLLDYNAIYVNATFLWPDIVGGLIMGVGFIIGGFCPGTSLVAAATLKLDGIVFVLGGLFGIFVFGETVANFNDFWNASYYGRLTLFDWMNIPAGVTLVMLVVMALLMFWGGEIAERFFGDGRPMKEISILPESRNKLIAASALLLLAVITMAIGQPTATERWDDIKAEKETLIKNRDVYVHPYEVAELKADTAIYVQVLDVRSEEDYNNFHLSNSLLISMDEIRSGKIVRRLAEAPSNSVIFVISNNERDATEAWKLLVAQSVVNVYIIKGGYNYWLDSYGIEPCVAVKNEKLKSRGEEQLLYVFNYAVGERCFTAHPESSEREYPPDCFMASHPELFKDGLKAITYDMNSGKDGKKKKRVFEKKVKIKKRRAISGGCG